MHKPPSPYKATWRQKAGRRERPSLTGTVRTLRTVALAMTQVWDNKASLL
jgi:hypothetical protein